MAKGPEFVARPTVEREKDPAINMFVRRDEIDLVNGVSDAFYSEQRIDFIVSTEELSLDDEKKEKKSSDHVRVVISSSNGNLGFFRSIVNEARSLQAQKEKSRRSL